MEHLWYLYRLHRNHGIMVYIACLDTKCNMDIVKKLCGNVEIEI